MRHGICTLLVLAAMPGMFAGAQAETLQEALIAAYETNPQLESQYEQSRIAQERLAQARAQKRPSVSVTTSYGYQSVETNRPFAVGTGEQPVGNASLEAIYPLYTGGRIDGGIRRAEAGVGSASERLRATEQELLLQALTSYMNVFRDRAAVDISQRSVELLEEQVRAAQDRFEVGEVTRTDVALAEARLEGTRASLAQAEAQLEGSEANYAFLVGFEPGFLTPPPETPELPSDVEDAITLALTVSPDIAASRFAEQAAIEGITVAKSALEPQISIVGSAQYQDSYHTNFHDSTVAATARATVPLFEGGLRRSQLREAKLERERARLATRNTERQLRSQISRAFFSYQASLRSVQASERQVEAAQIAFDGAEEELAVGVRTTLDVLQQEQELFEARLNLVRAERDAYVAAHELLRAMGILTPELMGLEVAQYDASDYGERVRRKWLLTDAN